MCIKRLLTQLNGNVGDTYFDRAIIDKKKVFQGFDDSASLAPRFSQSLERVIVVDCLGEVV